MHGFFIKNKNFRFLKFGIPKRCYRNQIKHFLLLIGLHAYHITVRAVLILLSLKKCAVIKMYSNAFHQLTTVHTYQGVGQQPQWRN